MFPYDKQHLHFKTIVPLYDELTVHLVITPNLRDAHRVLKVPYKPECARSGGEVHLDEGSDDVYIFITKSCVTHEWIGHELSHLTNCIAGRAGIEADRDNDEPDARIAGYLSKWVYRQLDKTGQQVHHKRQI